LDVQAGDVALQAFPLGGIVNFGISSPTNNGTISFPRPETINALSVNFQKGYAPVAGAFVVALWPLDANYWQITGFGPVTTTNMPVANSWSATNTDTGIYLQITGVRPRFSSVSLSGTNLIFTGVGGSPGSNYVILTSANLTLPLPDWTPLATNVFDVNGQFTYTNAVIHADRQQFFIFK